MELAWHTHPSPSPRGTTWKSYLGEACPHGKLIAIVDGTYVRNHYDSDFSQGGNGYRYRFIPKTEIWIDGQIDNAEWPLIAFHECVESELMKGGYGYSRAHDVAKRREDEFRRGKIR